MIILNCLLYDDDSNFGYREYARNLMFLYSRSSTNEIFLFKKSQKKSIENFCNLNNLSINTQYLDDYFWRLKLILLPLFLKKNITEIINTFNYGPLINLSFKNSVVIHDFKYKFKEYEPRLLFRLQRNFFIFFHNYFYEKIYCISENTKQDFIKFYGERRNLIVIHNYIDLKKYKNKICSKPLMKQNEKFILCVSADQSYKNVKYLIDEFQFYKKNTISKLKLLIVGTNEDYNDNDIVTVIKASQAQINQAFSQASIVIQPSFFEGFGYPYIESCVFKKTIVAIDIPIAREICDPLNSIFIKGKQRELQNVFQKIDFNEIKYDMSSDHISKFVDRNQKY